MGFIITIVCLGVVGFLGAALWGNAKQRKFEIKELKKLESQGINLSIQTKVFYGIIGLDPERKLLVILDSRITISKITIIKYADILTVKLMTNGEVMEEKSREKVLRRAYALKKQNSINQTTYADSLFNMKVIEDVKTVSLKITTHSLQNNFIFYDHTADNKAFESTLSQKARSWKNRLFEIIEKMDMEELEE